MAQTVSRMNHIFGTDGKTFILAMDHGSNFNVLPAMKDTKTLIRELAAAGADAFLSTIGMAENFAGSFLGKGIILRIDGGVSFLGDHKAPMQIVATAEDALRLGADSVITMSFPGSVHEAEVLSNLARVCLDCHKWGLPVTAEALPRGFEKAGDSRTPENITFACRQAAELGADIVKTVYTGDPESFRTLTESVYVPVVILGGAKKVPERELLQEIRDALDAGASGVAMGRNIWGNEDPVRYAAAIAKLIHEDCSVDAALKEMNRLYGKRGWTEMETYKVSIHSGVREMETRILQKREPAGDEVLLKVTSCAICTLEQRIWKGVIARYPYAGGHEAAGIVEAVGPDVKGVKPGDKAAARLLNSCGECYYCRSGHENLCVASFVAHTHSGVMGAGGFAEYMTVSAKAVYKLADDVDLDHAALAEPLACCVHSIRNARIQLGDDVVVIGAGIMGALHIRLAKMSGARVIVSELDPVRMDVARKMGADIVINANEADPIAQVKELTEGRGADAVFCTVATSAVAKQAVDMAGKLGRVVMYTSFFPDLPIEISPTKLHSGEQILTGSVNPNPVDFLTATRLLSRKLIDVSSLISDRVPMAEIDRAFREAVEPNTYRIIVKP